MLYRTLGKSGIKVSVLGFGCMRLPMLNSTSAADIFDPNKPIDEETAEGMVRYALQHGINYFDTAYPYHSGKSEIFLGKALRTNRDKVMIATKLPTWLVEKTSDFDRLLDEQLKKLETDYFDIYLLHGLTRPRWPKMKALGVEAFLDRIVADGRARHVGFSFHDDVRIFKEIVDGYDWTLCLIQYNYFDENYQAGREGLKYAALKGLGVIAMEPLRAGKLAGKVPSHIQAIWDLARIKRTPAEWALRWVWNHPEVSAALSGMGSMAQLIENIRIAETAEPNALSVDELALIGQAAATYRKMLTVNCTRCAYCMPCPQGVNIPVNFSLYNDTFMFKDEDANLVLYNRMLAPEQKASHCTECGECDIHCPQGIKISEALKNVHRTLVR